MKTFFIILTILHGLIHSLGFLKGFRLAELKEFITPVSKPLGIAWLIALMLIVASGLMYALNIKTWPLVAIVGVVISQILIFTFWKEAKIGTIPNVIILLVAIQAMAYHSFEQKILTEINLIESNAREEKQSAIEATKFDSLPMPVQRWLSQSGILEKDPIRIMKMEQRYQIKLSQDQKNWFIAKAKQSSAPFPPAFVWYCEMKMFGPVYAFGRDKFIDGAGEMNFRLLSLFSVALDRDNPQLNEAALQRFLGELVWYPSAAWLDYVQWEALSEEQVIARMEIQGVKAEGVFHFDEEGKVKKFTADRYMGSGPDAIKYPWEIEVMEYGEFDGISIPKTCQATWNLEEGPWTWAILEVEKVDWID